MLKRSHWIGLGLTLALVLVLLNLPDRMTSRLKIALSGLYLPLFGLASSAQKLGEAGGMRALPKSDLIEKIENLRRENEELRFEMMQTEEAARENAMLREAVGWQKRQSWKLRLARVIARDPANWWRTLQIDAGSNQGVARNMPVVTAQGLIGRVQEAGANRSRVILIGDPQCQVPALVDNAGRDTGILKAGEATVLDESLVELTYLSRNSQAIPGQKVLTSGLGGLFPKGIPVGTITETNSVAYGLYLEARVKLSANLRELEEVWVLYP
jgi:rod shape-determining protein MreC